MKFRRASKAPAAAQAATESPAAEAQRGHGLTIRLKLTLWYGTLFLVAGVLLIAVNYFMVRGSLTVAPEKARATVAEELGIPSEQLERSFSPQFAPQESEDWFLPGGTGGGHGAGDREPLQVLVQTEDGEYVAVDVPQLIQLTQQELKQEALRQLWIWSLVALAIMTVITFGSAWFLAGRMLRPLHAITSTARRLSGSTLHERIALKGPRDELKELADTFDGMLGRLDTAFTAQKDFVANASHELRTPLTIIRTEIDVALGDPDLSQEELREMGTAVTEAVDRSENLIDGLLVLASVDSVPILTELDLAEIAQNEVNLASGEADAQGLRLELDLQPAPVQGERSLIERMVANLLENAIRHNTPDGWFSVKTSAATNLATLEVANGGPVVPPEEVERLFDRFYRPDKSRSRKTGGFGLGLSIVKSVVAAHGGSVDLVAPEDGGLRVTISLPVSPPAGPGDGAQPA